MNDSWDDYAEEWDTNIDAISYSEKAYETLVRDVNIEGQNILDFGCGTGLLTERMSSSANRIVALDLSKKMIAILNSKNLPNVVSISEPLTSKLVRDNSAFVNKFNIIVASSVFSFVPDYESTLKLLKSLLVSGGLLIQWDWLSPDNNPEFGLSEVKIDKAFRDAGFKKLSIAKPFSLSGSKGNMLVVMGVAVNA
jgi:predicted TPR repeat methyltransferase